VVPESPTVSNKNKRTTAPRSKAYVDEDEENVTKARVKNKRNRRKQGEFEQRLPEFFSPSS